MKSRPALKKLSVLLVGLASAAAVQAAEVVTDWTYTLTGSWLQYELTNGSTFNPAANTKTISWGTPSTPNGNSSSLVITDPAANGGVSTQITGDIPQPGSTATGITLTHNNFPIFAPSLSSAVLRATLNLNAEQPAEADIGGPGALPPLEYDILFTETPNQTPCVIGTSPTACNDIFVQETGFLDQLLSYNGNNYFLNIFPASGGVLSTLSDAACAAAGADDGCLGFSTPEGQSTALQFGFTISTERFSQVPEPGILALLGIGLAAGALTGRRRRA